MKPKTDFTNTRCVVCGSKETYMRSPGDPDWRRFKDLNGIWDNKSHVCKKCYSKDYQRNNPNSTNNIIKSMADRRTNNLRDPRHILGDNCETLTSEIFGVKNLNKESNNYMSPIDHDRHPELGIIQTKGSYFHIDVGSKGGWKVNINISEFKKDYNNTVVWCISPDKKAIERCYIIPKQETDKRLSIGIVRSPTDCWGNIITSWYDKYRIKDDKIMTKINDIWKLIMKKGCT